MDATYSSETSVDFQWATRRDMPEDRTVDGKEWNIAQLFEIRYVLQATYFILAVEMKFFIILLKPV
jgi:hypothetical protein